MQLTHRVGTPLTLLLAMATLSQAGQMHARSTIGIGVSFSFAPHAGRAYASRSNGSKYRVSNAQLGSIYTYGNAGTGHAEHHNSLMGDDSGGGLGDAPPPIPGMPGSTQYFTARWSSNDAGDLITVNWLSDSFWQVDFADLDTPDNYLSSLSEFHADGGLDGEIGLIGRLVGGVQHLSIHRTGIFESAPVALVPYGNGIYSLELIAPMSRTAPGDMETYAIGMDASIVPEPASLAVLLPGLVMIVRRRRTPRS